MFPFVGVGQSLSDCPGMDPEILGPRLCPCPLAADLQGVTQRFLSPLYCPGAFKLLRRLNKSCKIRQG